MRKGMTYGKLWIIWPYVRGDVWFDFPLIASYMSPESLVFYHTASLQSYEIQTGVLSVVTYFIITHEEDNLYLQVSPYQNSQSSRIFKMFVGGGGVGFGWILGYFVRVFLLWVFVWVFSDRVEIRITKNKKSSRYEEAVLSSGLFTFCSLIIPKMLYLFTFLYCFLQHLPVSREAL